MADNVTNELILEHLKAIRAEIGTLQSDMSDVKASLTSLRQHLSGFMSTDAAHEGALASVQSRLNRIERRLEISEG
jgi:chromosome segregation ATPase